MSRVLGSSSGAALPPAWRAPLLGLLALLLGLGALFQGTLLAMVQIWHRSETFAHAFLVPPIALWLIWRRREQLRSLSPRPLPLLLLPMALLALVWLLGELVGSNAVTQAMVVAMVVLAVPTMLGLEVSRRIAFPLGFLFFCVPIGDFMLPVLMQYTADFTVAALRLSGIPVYREGLQFIIPSGQWSVVEACSGVRYLIASVMVGTLFAYLNFHSLKRRLLFILFATLLPVLANWLRAYGIVMLGHVSGNTLAVGADHLVYGWVFFGIVMLAMFSVGARWQEPEPELPAVAGARGGASPASFAWWLPVLSLLVLSLPVLLEQRLQSASTAPSNLSLETLQLPGWEHVPAEGPPGWAPTYRKPVTQSQALYRKGGQQVGLFLAYYRQQDHQSKLISSENVIVMPGDPHWARVGSAPRTLTLAGTVLPLDTVQLRRINSADAMPERLLVWRFFWVQGRLVSNEVYAKLHTAASRLLGHGDDAAAVLVYANVRERASAEAEQAMRDFLMENWAEIAASLERARGDAP
jgi:exosortase A